MKKILAIIAVTATLTALCVKAAYIQRGYFAVGGEWLLWIYPLLFFAVKKCEKERRNEND